MRDRKFKENLAAVLRFNVYLLKKALKKMVVRRYRFGGLTEKTTIE